MAAHTLGGEDVLARALKATRAADEAFQKAGGSSRHWLRDWFIPSLVAQNLAIYDLEEGERIAKEREQWSAEKEQFKAEITAERAARIAAEQRAEMACVAALESLLVWAKWDKKRRGAPSMDEPNTGAVDAAESALAALKEKP